MMTTVRNGKRRRWFRKERVPAALVWQRLGGDRAYAGLRRELDVDTATFEMIMLDVPGTGDLVQEVKEEQGNG